ncbi:MAG: RdgB/HAM1 family non-canonical purine NTP pyrophosphatase [Clostridia bacterium]|nr:RdgB/HAM1 family non-canonical purine NTP pyrophosphatase [Clostridia bacterium]
MKFFIASKNKHKIAEFVRILKPMNIDVISEADLDTPLSEVEETGVTFAENAFLKAQMAMKETGLPSIADDSGLCVDYLDGAPGIYSARFAGEPTDNKKNNEKLLTLLKDVPFENRGAHFCSSIVCVFPNNDKITAEGKCFGKIATEYIGNNGFGYDPLFISSLGSFGEITDEQKDSISHRGVALKEFAEKLSVYLKEV